MDVAEHEYKITLYDDREMIHDKGSCEKVEEAIRSVYTAFRSHTKNLMFVSYPEEMEEVKEQLKKMEKNLGDRMIEIYDRYGDVIQAAPEEVYTSYYGLEHGLMEHFMHLEELTVQMLMQSANETNKPVAPSLHTDQPAEVIHAVNEPEEKQRTISNDERSPTSGSSIIAVTHDLQQEIKDETKAAEADDTQEVIGQLQNESGNLSAADSAKDIADMMRYAITETQEEDDFPALQEEVKNPLPTPEVKTLDQLLTESEEKNNDDDRLLGLTGAPSLPGSLSLKMEEQKGASVAPEKAKRKKITKKKKKKKRSSHQSQSTWKEAFVSEKLIRNQYRFYYITGDYSHEVAKQKVKEDFKSYDRTDLDTYLDDLPEEENIRKNKAEIVKNRKKGKNKTKRKR